MLLLRLILPLLIILLVAVIVLRLYRAVTRPRTKTGAKPQKARIKTSYHDTQPQQAAVAMLVAMARDSGSITDKERDEIFSIITTVFQLSEGSAEKLYYKGIDLQSKASDLTHLFNSLSPVINDNCSYIEKKELYEMLVKVASCENGTVTDSQRKALRQLEEYLEIGTQNMNIPSA